MPYLGNTTTSFNVDGNNINNGAITSEKIAAGAVVNADVNDSASIAGTKISADFGAQDLIVDTNLLFVDVSEDRIGIGTSSPFGALQVREGTNANVIFDTDGTETAIQAFNDAGNAQVPLRLRASEIKLFADGTQALTINSSQQVGIGTTSPEALLEVEGADTAIGSNGTILVKADSAGADDGGQITLGSANGRHVAVAGRSEGSSGTAGYLQLGVRGSSGDIVERLRIDSSGRLLVGTSTVYNSNDNVVIQKTDGAARIGFQHSTTGQVTAGEELGALVFYSNDGDQNLSASIVAAADLDHAAGDKPGRLLFYTTADGASTVTERMQINSSGRVRIGSTGGIICPLNVRAMANGNIHFRPINDVTGSGTGVAIDILNDATTTINDLALRGATTIFRNASGETARINSSGQLLLGTTTEGHSSADDFTIADSGDVGITIRSTDSNQTQISFSDGTSGEDEYRGQISYFHTDDYMRFRTNAVERLRIINNGAWGLAGANYGTSGQVLTSQGSGSAPQWADAGLTWLTSQDLTGESSVTFTGIATTANIIKVGFAFVSQTSNASGGQILIRLGNGSIVSTGNSYRYGGSYGSNFHGSDGGNEWSLIHSAFTGANSIFFGTMELVRIAGANWWCCSWNLGDPGGDNYTNVGGGFYNGSSGLIDRIQILNGANTFDDGNVVVGYA